MANEPHNQFAAGFYGILILLISVSNIWQYASLSQGPDFKRYLKNMGIDITIKLVGLLIAITVFPMAMPIFVFIAGAFLYATLIVNSKKEA